MTERNIPHLRDIFGLPGEPARTPPTPPDADSGGGGGGGGGKKRHEIRRDNAKTFTERDVKHLERHLSMKKTIRKKMMRDLQTAFVEEPVEPARSATSTGGSGATVAGPDASFLDMLRGGADPGEQRDNRKTGFWSIFKVKPRNKR